MVEMNANSVDSVIPALRKADISSGFSHLEQIVSSATRPFVLINERELSVLRRGLTKDGWKRNLYLQPAKKLAGMYSGGGILSLANKWLNEEIKIPEPSGHFHHFFCDCGSRLSIPENFVTGCEYFCPECNSVYTGEKYDGGLRHIHHSQITGALLALALIYGLDKEKTYADKAAEILTKYADAYSEILSKNPAGGMWLQSLDEAVWAIPLAQAYDLIFYSRSLTESDKDKIEEKLLRPVANRLRNAGIQGNWGSWHLSAVGVLGLTMKDSSLVRYALESFETQMAEELGDDGLWPESVHTYHFYPLMAFIHLAEACYRAGIDIYNWRVRPGKSLKNMFLAPIWYAYPSFRLPAINDGWYDSHLPLGLYEIAHRRWDDPEFAWVLKNGYRFGQMPVNLDQKNHQDKFTRSSFYAFLFGRDLPGRITMPQLGSKDFHNIGICVLRNQGTSTATFDYGPFLGHGHLDKLSFTFYANDELLIPDYGTPGYGAGILEWYQGTASHNTILVDEKSQTPSKSRSLTTRCFSERIQFAEATADDCYDGVKHNRRLYLIDDILIVKDIVESNEIHKYDWLVRCVGNPKCDMSPIGKTADFSSYKFVKIDELYDSIGQLSLKWHCENGDLDLLLWTDTGDAVFALGECPAETAHKKASMLICRQNSNNAKFTSVFAPSRSRRLSMERDGNLVRVEDGEKTMLICINDGLNGSGKEVISDGELAAVLLESGRIRNVMLVGGSKVEWNNQQIVECQFPAKCVEISFDDRNPSMRYFGDVAGNVKIKSKSRAMRVNGQRTGATCVNGHATIRITPQILNQKI